MHPSVLEAFERGELAERFARARPSSRAVAGLTVRERELLAFLASAVSLREVARTPRSRRAAG